MFDIEIHEKNIFYPTDAKLHKKIIYGCRKIGWKKDLKLNQSYTRTFA
jgi:IS5 family transposase